MASYQHPRSINVMLFDRSDPNEITGIEMKATGGRKKPRKFKRIFYLRESLRKWGYFSGRSDIVMVNISSGSVIDQHVAYPTWSGEPRGEAMRYLNPDEIEAAREINRKILATLDEYPEMALMLDRRREDGQSTREWVDEQIVLRKTPIALGGKAEVKAA